MPVVDGLKAHTLRAEGEGQSGLDFGLIRFRRSSTNVFLITKTAILSKAYLVPKSWMFFLFFRKFEKFSKERWRERVTKLKPFLSTETEAAVSERKSGRFKHYPISTRIIRSNHLAEAIRIEDYSSFFQPAHLKHRAFSYLV